MSSHRRPTARAFNPLRILIALALSVLVLPVMASPAVAAVTEIVNDGNQDNEPSAASNDWQGLAGPPIDNALSLIEDPIGPADLTTYGQQNTSEGNYPNWQAGSPGTASGKSDIGNVYVYDWRRSSDDHILVALAWDRAGDSGTGRYYVELNQQKDQGLVPDRLANDRRITIGINGSDVLVCQRIERWDGTTWVGGVAGSCSSIPVKVNTIDIADYFSSPNATEAGILVENTFIETVIDLTAFGASSCPVSGYQSLSIRSQEGGEDVDNSALKDRATGNVTIQSDCASIVIEKKNKEGGGLLGGATFTIAPNPLAGVVDATPKTVTDNDANVTPGELPDADPTVGIIKVVNVKPGVQYTVTETTAPSGYLLPPPAPEPGPNGPPCPSEGYYRCLSGTTTAGGSLSFTFLDIRAYAAPTVQKTVNATYNTSYTWTVDKGVRVPRPEGETPDLFTPTASQNVPAAAQGTTSAPFEYEVTASVTQQRSAFTVSGTVKILNTNDRPMTVTLSDQLSVGTTCTFLGVTDASGDTGLQVTVAANAGTSQAGYAYTCSPSNHADGTNTATVTWSKTAYPQNQGDVDAVTDNDSTTPGVGTASSSAMPYSFVPGTEVNRSATITDTHHTWNPAWTMSWTDGGPATQTESRTYTRNVAGQVGRCSSETNIATVDLASGTDPSEDAVATVCVGGNLTITKNVVTSLKRSYAYSIDKQASSSTVNVDPVTGKATVGYNVVVTEGTATDSDWLMSGKITVTNPNNQPVTLTSITDKYGATSCSVVEGDKVIPAENYQVEGIQGQRVFDYTCSFGNTKPPYDAANVAEVKWNKATFGSSSDTASFSVQMTPSLWEGVDVTGDNVTSTMTKVNPTVTVVDNKTVASQSVTLGTVTWSRAGKQTTFTYSLQLQGSAGRCVPYTNTARISETGQSDAASVTVCWPVGPTVSKTAVGTYDRTYLWAIDKEADQTSVETDGQNGTEVNYTVTATPDGYVDDGWTMSGTITVSNPNDFQWMTVDIVDVPNIGGGATCTVSNGDDVAVPAGALVNGQIVPGTATRDYTCTVPAQPLYTGGTNTATITWAGGSASSGALPVVFAVDEETDEVVTVVDDKTVQGEEVELGEATWNDLDEPTVFTYSLELEAEANECVDYVNTAEILETGQFVDVTVEACGPEVLPDEVVVPEPQPRPEPVVKGVDTVIPDTGGPNAVLMWTGLALLLMGGVLLMTSRTRRSRA